MRGISGSSVLVVVALGAVACSRKAPCEQLRDRICAQVDRETCDRLRGDGSQPFARPEMGSFCEQILASDQAVAAFAMQSAMASGHLEPQASPAAARFAGLVKDQPLGVANGCVVPGTIRREPGKVSFRLATFDRAWDVESAVDPGPDKLRDGVDVRAPTDAKWGDTHIVATGLETDGYPDDNCPPKLFAP